MNPHTPSTPEADGRARESLASVVRFFEGIGPEDVARIGELYAGDARFVDPFNDVTGCAAIERIFAHMFVQLDSPRFVVHDRICDGAQAFLTWDFEFRFRSGAPRGLQRIRGSTHLRFAADGKVALHRDYWDAAAELYEKLPVVGALMRWLRRRASAPG